MVYLLHNFDETSLARFNNINLPKDIRGSFKQVNSLLARGLLCYGIKQEYGIKLPIIETDKNGKPYFKHQPDIFFNLSHTEGLVACIIHEKPCGIDVERVQEIKNFNRMTDRICSIEEKAAILSSNNPHVEFIKYWCLKESYVKAVGKGLSFSLQKINFSFLNEQIISNDKAYVFTLSNPFDNYYMAICKNL